MEAVSVTPEDEDEWALKGAHLFSLLLQENDLRLQADLAAVWGFLALMTKKKKMGMVKQKQLFFFLNVRRCVR